jgi:hypothetical protein
MASKKPKELFSCVLSIQYANEDSNQWEQADIRRVHANRCPATARCLAEVIEEEMTQLFYGIPVPEVGDKVAAKLRLDITIERRCCNEQ